MLNPSTLQPADILVTRTKKGLFPRAIRLAAALQDKPNLGNHVVVVHHIDAAGTIWGIEGRPGGVGWVDCKKYLGSPWTVSNAAQPKTDQQRVDVCTAAEGMLATPYDWEGIVLDGMKAIGAQELWTDKEWGKQAPAHVVCSSYAAWLYCHVGLAAPAQLQDSRTTTPGDWGQFIVTTGWAA